MDNTDAEIMKALNTIQNFCNERNHNCINCNFSNNKNECLIYEYPYLWKIHYTNIIKYLDDD